MNNFNENNIKFISKHFGDRHIAKSNKEWMMLQRSAPCKVIPAVSAMKKSVDYLFK